jgi:hypothetical protein
MPLIESELIVKPEIGEESVFPFWICYKPIMKTRPSMLDFGWKRGSTTDRNDSSPRHPQKKACAIADA